LHQPGCAQGIAAESNTIRIGTQGTQTATYIAGVSATTVTGADVVISSTGRLGIVMSSARFKRNIRDMGAKSSALLKLRPVSFRYNNDPTNTLQYGLVAEDVAKVYPELVVYGPDGKVLTVRYSMLTSMLLNGLQKQSRENEHLSAQLVALKTSTGRALAAMQERMAALEQARQLKDGDGKLAAVSLPSR